MSQTVEMESDTRLSHESESGSTQQIIDFVGELSATMSKAVKEIKEVNSRTLLLSLNAKIEAHRAGAAGAAFGVVANEMQQLADMTTHAADQMENDAKVSIKNLQEKIRTNIRGSRLSDLAMVNIDLVDRNLYERTCDVRWWATDSSLVDALQSRTTEGFAFASKRLGVILDAYTVYHDLVLCDAQGNVVANGRPQVYQSQGTNQSAAPWFRQAMQSPSGQEFGFQSAHLSPLVNRQSVLIYSCGVREDGESNGRLLGALGILFDWETFSQTIVNQTPIAPSEREQTRCMICTHDGMILADSKGKQLQESLEMTRLGDITSSAKGYRMIGLGSQQQCLAHAKSPGFETYKTGWHSVILQADPARPGNRHG